MTDYTDLIEQLLTKSENSPWDSLMDDAAIAIQSQGKRIAELEAQLSAIRALLPDDLYSHSKDWSSGNLADRIEWLKIGYESQKSLVSEYENQLAALAKQEPALYVQSNHFSNAKFAPFLARICQQPMEGVSAMELYAQPVQSEPGKVTVTTDDHGRCVAVTRTDDEGRILSVIWEAGEMEKPVNARLLGLLKEYAENSSHLQETMGFTESARAAIAAAEAQQAEPVLPANKTHGDSHAWLAWALHIIRERCPDVLTSHQYDCASKALAAGYAKEPVRISRQQRAALIAEFDQSSKRHPVRIAVVDLMNRTEDAALRANGFKVDD